MSYRIECPYCHRTGFVRAERVIKGAAAITTYFCGACTRTWEKPDDDDGKPPSERNRR